MLLLLFLVAPAPAFAANPPEDLHFTGRYDFSWSGIALGAVEIAIDETPDHYSIHLVAVSKGIVNLFTRHRSDTTVEGIRTGNTYLPQHYECHYWTKNKPRHVRLAYDARGAITEELNEPPEDRSDRPEVPHALKDGTLDPLTLLLAVPHGDLKPRSFDAKRLYEGTAIKGAPGALRIDGVRMPAVPYLLSRKPIAGLTQKELREYGKGEPPLTFYFSDDERHIPLYMSLPIFLGAVKGSLTKECKTWDECKVN